jgi:hypothetical protein
VAENLERLVRMMKLKRINIGDKYSFYSAFVFEDVFENEKFKFTQGSNFKNVWQTLFKMLKRRKH